MWAYCFFQMVEIPMKQYSWYNRYNYYIYKYWDLLTKKEWNKFSFTNWCKYQKAKLMSRVAFFTFEENRTANQEPHIMFFHVRALARRFSFIPDWQHCTFETVRKIVQLRCPACFQSRISLKIWMRKDLSLLKLHYRIMLEVWRTETREYKLI